jgi:nitric oxide reductase NorD protein
MGGFEGLLTSAERAAALDRKSWSQVRRAFTGRAFDLWVDAFEKLASNAASAVILRAFAFGTSAVAEAHGSDAALSVVPVALGLAKSLGSSILQQFLSVLPEVVVAAKDLASFRIWLRSVEEVVSLAPESVELILRQSPPVLTRLNAVAFRSWLLNGVRVGGTDPAQRYAYYAHIDSDTLTAFERRTGDVTFADAEKSIRAVLMALWRLRPAIRVAHIRPGPGAPRRSSFDGPFIRLPEIFPSYRGPEAIAHFHALTAHIGAHLVYSIQKFPVGTLKPVQLALVSLVEDARVETLAAREYPGLRRLWGRFHVARPGSALTAELLMMRLSRALIDPSYVDDDPFVIKGRMMFFDHRANWEDQAISRSIGNLLGNDIGQMRVQFNAKSYITEPSYRDDNSGLWDYGESPPQQVETAEVVLESVRINAIESKTDRDRRERDDNESAPANMAAKVVAVPDDHGIPIARYSEWDHISGTLRPEWTTVMEFEAKPASPLALDEMVSTYAEVQARIAKLVKAAKVSRPSKLRRQAHGDRLDLDACIRATIDKRSGLWPDPRIYETTELRSRDLSVLLLLDSSESTRDRVKNTTFSVIAMERAAAVLLAQAMAELGDPFAIHGFCSNGREEVRYYRLKRFDETYDAGTRARLAGLRGALSTRLGAALRHAGHEIARQPTHRKLVLMISDGEPSDVDIADQRYLVEDARKAAQELTHQGIDVFCVCLDSGGETYLPRIFGPRNYLMISRIEMLPEKLPMIYFRLTV